MTSSFILLALLFTAIGGFHLEYKDRRPVSRVAFDKEKDTPFNVLSIIVPSSDVKTGDYYMPHSTVRLRQLHSVAPEFSVKLADVRMNHAVVKLTMANSEGELWSHHYTLKDFDTVCKEGIADNDLVLSCTASPTLATIREIFLPTAEMLDEQFRDRMNMMRVELIAVYKHKPTTLFAVDFYVTVE